MPNYDQWTVDVTQEEPVTDDRLHPHTGARLFPEGFIVGKRVTMRLTHTPTGTVIDRTDFFGPCDKARVMTYARNVIASLDDTLSGASESVLGPLNVEPMAPEDTRTQADKDRQAFEQAAAIYARQAALVETLTDISPDDAADLAKHVDQLRAARDAAAVPVIAAVKALAVEG